MLSGQSMFLQFECHAVVIKSAKTKPYFDLEPWRPVVSGLQELLDRCNPPPAVGPYGVGENTGGTISSPTQLSFEQQLLHRRNGGPPALGEPGGEAVQVGEDCFQENVGGSLGQVGGAGGVSVIAARSCDSGGSAHVVADYSMGYFHRIVPWRVPQGLDPEATQAALSEIGYPIDNGKQWGGGIVQGFEGGRRGPNLLLRPYLTDPNVYDVQEPVLADYLKLAGPRGALGYPTSDQFICTYPYGVCQDFVGGTIEYNLGTYVVSLRSPFYVYHVYGTCADGACGLNARTDPAYSGDMSAGVLHDGHPVDIVCQMVGELVTPNHGIGSKVWDELTNGYWLSDVYVDTPGKGGAFSPPIPPCQLGS